MGNIEQIHAWKFLIVMCTALILFQKVNAQGFASFDIISTLNYVQALLTHIGPILSAILFIVAGIFYAIGQLFPSHQRASFHTTSGDLIMGAIIVAVLSVAANSFALASTHLLSNVTNIT
ncbi:MAG: hypothetical protein M1569_04025 [Candidatus Marsarchaeota archaeon]|nr:hypothetical protein [Candidatus Marsarchaeota archaeon]MCL5413540.1 hypothetical protein [Candidatus Marsarchaeota archaeon]